MGSPVVLTCSATLHTHRWPLMVSASQASSPAGVLGVRYGGHLLSADSFGLCWAPGVSDGVRRSARSQFKFKFKAPPFAIEALNSRLEFCTSDYQLFSKILRCFLFNKL